MVPGSGNEIIFTCPRCGTYSVQRKLLKAFPEGFEERDGLILSGLARIATDDDEPPLKIAEQFDRELVRRASPPTSFADRVDHLLLHVAKLSRYPGLRTQPVPQEQIAARLFLPTEAFAALVQLVAEQRILSTPELDVMGTSFMLLPEGWARVDQLQRQGARGSRAFVAMSFNNALKAAFEDGIKPALIECGYEPPFRTDDPEHEAHHGEPDYQPKIDDRIMAEIRRARFVVADITGNRSAVYYEAGFAEGLGKPVIFTGRKNSFEADACFDTRQVPHVLWEDPEDLKAQLLLRIQARDRTLKT